MGMGYKEYLEVYEEYIKKTSYLIYIRPENNILKRYYNSEEFYHEVIIELIKKFPIYYPEKCGYKTFITRAIIQCANLLKRYHFAEKRVIDNTCKYDCELRTKDDEDKEVSYYESASYEDDYTILENLDLKQFTEREMEIIKLRLEGYSLGEIGEKLDISKSYVCKIQNDIRKRIGH